MARGVGVTDRSLIYFLFFLVIYFGYTLYEQDQESERLFKIASDQQGTIEKLREAIDSQKVYIELLESRVIQDYYNNNSQSPIYNKLL
jgi:amino acid permease